MINFQYQSQLNSSTLQTSDKILLQRCRTFDKIWKKILEEFEPPPIEQSIKEELDEFKPIITNNILKLNYDKNKTNIKKIINILNNNGIEFKEINTSEGDLEDVFIKVVSKNDTTV